MADVKITDLPVSGVPDAPDVLPIVDVSGTPTTKQVAVSDLQSAIRTVESVFGRTGTVGAAGGDYVASEVDNDSGVAGANVKAALDTLDAAIGVYGDEQQKIESAGDSSTTLNIFSTKATLVTSSLPSGDYVLEVGYGWTYDNTNTFFEAEVRNNAIRLGGLHQEEPKDALNLMYTARRFFLDAISGVQTIDVRWQAGTGGNTATIRDTSIYLYRRG